MRNISLIMVNDLFLREISYIPKKKSETRFPFNLPLLSELKKISFLSPITILVGENGAGKSTLLETLAVKINVQSLSENSLELDPTLTHARDLANNIRLIWNLKTSHGFFLRAEDYFSFLKETEKERQYYKKEYENVENEYKNHSKFTQNQAKMTLSSSIHDIKRKFGENADGQSHGESFLDIFVRRLNRKGIFLIDEPEAALSPISQFALISMIQNVIPLGSQFIIATHSPILMAIPNATLLNCDVSPPQFTNYDDVEHVILYREFLRDPSNFLHRL